MAPLHAEKMGQFSHNQLLVTSQVSLCTSDSAATVCYIVSYLIDLVITLKMTIWGKLGDLTYFGTIPGRFTRGHAIKYTAGSKWAIGTIWVFTIGVGVLCLFFD